MIEEILSDLRRIVYDYEEYPDVLVSALKSIIDKYDNRFDHLLHFVNLEEDVL